MTFCRDAPPCISTFFNIFTKKTMDYKSIVEQVSKAAKIVGDFLRTERANSSPTIEIKGKNDFVTFYDKEAEKRIIESLKNIVPEAGFITEEETETEKGEIYNWIIDPIDGTTNFIHGLFPYCISIALTKNDEIVVGVIYEVGLDECFSAYKGGGAWLNGEKISVTENATIEDSLIATGFPYSNFSLMDEFIKSLHFFMQNSHGMRRMGSAAADLAYVACGRFDAFYEYNLKPWDVAAGAIIVKEAGGIVSDFSGNDDFLFGREIIATNSKIYNVFQEKVEDFLKK